MKIRIYKDNAGAYRWRASEVNGRIIADGSEGYDSFQNCQRAVENVVGEFRQSLEVWLLEGKIPRMMTKVI